MITTNEPIYNLDRPPILLAEKRADFTCRVCGRPGYGAPNAAVHPGHCRQEWTRRISNRTAERNRRKRLLARSGQQSQQAVA